MDEVEYTGILIKSDLIFFDESNKILLLATSA